MKHGKSNHQIGEKKKAKDFRVMQTSCKDVSGAPELCSDQPSSGKRSQIRGDTEEATGVITEREFLVERAQGRGGLIQVFLPLKWLIHTEPGLGRSSIESLKTEESIFFSLRR